MSYEHGRFVWFELLTKDIEKAKAFYPETLPWKIQAIPMQDGSNYTMISVQDVGVGGLFASQGEAPSSWISYVSVEDVDETASRVRAAGGSTQMDAFDVPGVGRMQPVSDPQGGRFSLFEAETGDPTRVEGLGSVHWNELWTQDPEASVEFYGNVLGYTHDAMPMPHGGTYYILKNGDEMRGGIMKAPNSDVPAMWLQYIAVEDCDATLERARQNGATIVGEPIDAEGVGRFAILRDPLGAMIGVIKPAGS